MAGFKFNNGIFERIGGVRAARAIRRQAFGFSAFTGIAPRLDRIKHISACTGHGCIDPTAVIAPRAQQTRVAVL